MFCNISFQRSLPSVVLFSLHSIPLRFQFFVPACRFITVSYCGDSANLKWVSNFTKSCCSNLCGNFDWSEWESKETEWIPVQYWFFLQRTVSSRQLNHLLCIWYPCHSLCFRWRCAASWWYSPSPCTPSSRAWQWASRKRQESVQCAVCGRNWKMCDISHDHLDLWLWDYDRFSSPRRPTFGTSSSLSPPTSSSYRSASAFSSSRRGSDRSSSSSIRLEIPRGNNNLSCVTEQLNICHFCCWCCWCFRTAD